MAIEFASMTQQQIDAYLQAPRHAVVATNRVDGAPQISPVWFLYEQGNIYIGFDAGSAKHRCLQRDPRISICIDAGHPDARAVTIYGTAKIIEHRTPWRDDMFWRITRRFTESDEEARRFIEETTSSADEVLIVVTPTKIIARDYN